jgi:hypothetical protein
MEWKGMETPCMLDGTGGIRFGQAFTLRARIKADIIGGKQSIFSKRVPLSTGNRPGLVLFLHGSMIKMMTFQDGGESWITTASLPNPKHDPRLINVGEEHEILIYRSEGNARIYINGIDRTHPKYKTCCPGDINCDMDIFLGCQLYDTPEISEPFTGKIRMIELYDEAYYSSASHVRYPNNPYSFPLNQLPQKNQELKLGLKL